MLSQAGQIPADFRGSKEDVNERRREERLKICVSCSFSVDEGPLNEAVTHDLAASGLAIKSDMKPEKGSKIQLIFREYGAHTGHISRVFDDGFAVCLPQSSLAVLALSRI